MSQYTEFDFSGFRSVVIDASDIGIGQAAEVVVTQAKINLSRQGVTKEAKRGKSLLRLAQDVGSTSGRPFDTSRELFRLIGGNPTTGRLRTSGRRGVQIRQALTLRRIGDTDAPGGYPRLITGLLRRSIRSGRAVGTQPVKGERVVGSTMDPREGYAAAQEFGSPKLGLPARPYVRPAAQLTRGQQADAFYRAATAAMRAKGL